MDDDTEIRIENDELKNKLKNICKKVASGELFENAIDEFFERNREWVFKVALPAAKKLRARTTIYARGQSIYNNPMGVGILSCSCGSTEESCFEDGEGKFSWFEFYDDGTIFRDVVDK